MLLYTFQYKYKNTEQKKETKMLFFNFLHFKEKNWFIF